MAVKWKDVELGAKHNFHHGIGLITKCERIIGFTKTMDKGVEMLNIHFMLPCTVNNCNDPVMEKPDKKDIIAIFDKLDLKHLYLDVVKTRMVYTVEALVTTVSFPDGGIFDEVKIMVDYNFDSFMFTDLIDIQSIHRASFENKTVKVQENGNGYLIAYTEKRDVCTINIHGVPEADSTQLIFTAKVNGKPVILLERDLLTILDDYVPFIESRRSINAICLNTKGELISPITNWRYNFRALNRLNTLLVRQQNEGKSNKAIVEKIKQNNSPFAVLGKLM